MSPPLTNSKLKAYLDLARLHFVFILPIIFIAGPFMTFEDYGSFSHSHTVKAILISTFGFEAVFILNDIVDIDYDRHDVDWRITKYWRPFGSRLLVSEEISKGIAQLIFAALILVVAVLIYNLPTPNRYYLYLIMAYTYIMECLYQVIKRNQGLPIAQLLGRTDFMFFALGGYLCFGRPNIGLVLYAIFFYTLAEVHLGINDLSDYNNDLVRKMNMVTTIYGTYGNMLWIAFFTILHLTLGSLHIINRGGVTFLGLGLALLILPYINLRLRKNTTPEEALRVVPLFHMSMLVYMLTMILDSYLGF